MTKMTMARYIDADALREKMFHEAFEKDSQDQKWDSGCWIRYHMFENAVDSIPTADVVERKNGKWLAIGNTGLAACECGFITDRYSAYNFCPNCGAQMDERRKENG